jgi:hypothetical protein
MAFMSLIMERILIPCLHNGRHLLLGNGGLSSTDSSSVIMVACELLFLGERYKEQWYGRTVKVIDTFSPTTKTCSFCGYVNKDLKLSQLV